MKALSLFSACLFLVMFLCGAGNFEKKREESPHAIAAIIQSCEETGAAVYSSSSKNYTVRFYQGGFPGVDSFGNDKPVKAFKSRAQLRRYGMSLLLKRGGKAKSDESISKIESNPTFKKFNSRYSDSFFKSKELVVALVDRGSGNAKYSVSGMKVEGGTLVIDVKKSLPGIATLDYVPWVMVMELDKGVFNYKDVRINLT